MNNTQTPHNKPALLRGLYGITDPVISPGKKLLSDVESALRGGCRVIQYRDKNASEVEAFETAKSLRKLCKDYRAQFIVNDDTDLCLRVDADGVHLGKSDGNIDSARQQLGPDRILGVTCHNDLAYAQHAIQAGADYCAFGRIFPSQTKPNAPHCPIDLLGRASRLSVPSVAIGGITLDNIKAIVEHDISSIAVIHGLFGQSDIEETARKFSAYF